jgi:CO/xanthine dehydrogenase Mo-binding subunit
MNGIENASRRRFLTGGMVSAESLILGVRYYPVPAAADELPHDTNADHATLHSSVYLGINPDGTVWIVAHRSEMGTTSRTTLPLVVADELDADWKRVKIEQAIGDTYVATVVEVEVNDQGEVRIPRVDVALDAGLVVNPEATRAQFEGAAVFGTSVARTGEITATKGAIDQSNFQDYPVARINEVPAETNVYIVDSNAPPAGVGEPGVPPFIAAFCNAIFAATGKRVRDLPITKLGLS